MADMTAQGVDVANALSLAERKEAAYNALNTAYGPAIAADPTNAFNAAKASVAQQTIPTQVAQDQANLQTTQLQNQNTQNEQQRLAAYRATQMLASQADPVSGAIPQDAFDKIVRPNAGLLGIDPAHLDSFGQMLTGAGGVQHLNNIAQALVGPTKITGATSYGVDANGNTVAITRDQYGNIHQTPLGGTETTQQQNAITNQKKVPIAQQNADAHTVQAGAAAANARTGAYRASVYANNSVYGPGSLPGDNRPSANFGGGNTLPAPSTDLIHAGNPNGTTAQPQVDPNSLFAKLPPKGKQQAIGQATQIVNQGQNLQTTNTLLDTVMRQISPYTTGTGSLLNKLPGTLQTDLKANLASLKAQGLTSWIQSLKNAGGSTGIGRVLQSEANAAVALYGNMEQDQSAKQLAFHAQLFRQTVNSLYQHAQQGYKAMYGVDAHSAIGDTPPPAAGGTLPQGWKYLGAK